MAGGDVPAESPSLCIWAYCLHHPRAPGVRYPAPRAPLLRSVGTPTPTHRAGPSCPRPETRSLGAEETQARPLRGQR